LPVAANPLERYFAAGKPDRVWLADIADIPTGEGWLCLAVIRDLFSRKLVGRAMRDPMRAELTIAAFMAIQRRRPAPALTHHSDRGSQYAAGDYRKIPQTAAITQSMRRKAKRRDNAPRESFSGTLKTELAHQRGYPDREPARRDLSAYVKGYHQRKRIHSAVGYITPEQPDRKTA
jgi:transposase InsO family protein